MQHLPRMYRRRSGDEVSTEPDVVVARGVWPVLETVKGPEILAISVVDAGIVRDVLLGEHALRW